MTPQTAWIVVIASVVGITGIVFYNTIITGAWRNRAPGESESWRAGVFYFNRDDARLFLPKRTGLGWTINFAQPLAIVIALLMVAGLVALSFALRAGA